MIEHLFALVKRAALGTLPEVGAIVELRLLGPVELIGPDGLIRLGGPHRRAIVAQLALHEGQTVTTDELVEGLWADAAPANARKSLSTQVAQLRRALAEIDARLEHTGGGYRLDLPPGRLDLHRFEQAERASTELAAAGHTSSAIERQREALACWHGPPLADLAHFPFAATAASWLLPRLHTAQDRLADLLLGAGDVDEAVLLLERLVDESPYDERRWAQLVRALSAGGRRRDALQAYQRAREQLGEGLGLDPGRELRDVERDVLAGATTRPTATAEPRRPAELVGRTVELDRLDHALERIGRAPQVVAVLGEPGIGKTRLLAEFVRRVRARGITALMGGCEPSQSVPLQSLLAALDPLLSDPVTPGAAAIDPDLLPLLEGPATAPSLVEPTGLDLRRFRVIRALSRTIANLAVPGPLVLVLDDIHWLDPFTAAVLDHLCTDMTRPVLLVVGASTAPGTWPMVEERLVRYERSVPLERLRLRPLSSAELQALVRGHAVGVDDVDVLATQIHEASGGNALYATQLARAAAPTGRLPATVPDGLDAMCRSRVAVISPPARSLLDAVAVLGIDVDVDVITAMLGTSAEDVDERVQEVVAAGLLTDPERADHHRFTHGVVRQVVYDDLTPARRRRLHAQAADALEARASTEDPAAVALVAHHLRHARPLVDDDRVRTALEAAGRQAAHRGALEAGRKLLAEALDLAVTAVDRAAIEIASGIMGLAAGDRTALKQIDDAADVARTHGRWDLVADAAIARAQLQSSPSPQRSQIMATELEEIVHHLDEADLGRQAMLQTWRAYLLVNVDAERSLAAVDTADALAAAASPALQVTVATRYVRLRQAESRGDDPTACVRDALALATDTVLAGEPGLASYGHVACQAARLRAGLYDECQEDQPAYLQHAIDTHQRAIELQLVAVDVALRFATGTVDEADAASLALFERLHEAGAEAAEQVRFVQQLFVERERGGSPRWARILTQVAKVPLRGTEAVIAAGLVAIDEQAAREVLAPFLAGLDRVRRDWSHDALAALAADVVSDLGLTGPHVDQLYRALLPASGQVVTLTSVVMVLGRADRYLGRLAHLAGDAERAIAHLELARRLDDAAGSGLWAGWAARDEAVVRLERGAPGDQEVAADLLDLARARARHHGSDRLARAAST
jgi:DNA-binding SARP family transcriptional activator